MSRRLLVLGPTLLSLAAFLLALTAGLTGWERHAADEGIGAHLFQLLIVVQVPLIVALALTTHGRCRVLWVQAALLAAAFVPVAAFGL